MYWSNVWEFVFSLSNRRRVLFRMTPLTSSLPLVSNAVQCELQGGRDGTRPSAYRLSLSLVLFLKITSSLTFSSFCLTSSSNFFFLFSLFLYFCLSPFSPSPSPCIYHSLTPLWRVHAVPVNKNTIWIFLRPTAGETYEDWYVHCLWLTVMFWARLLLLAARNNLSWKGHISSRGALV